MEPFIVSARKYRPQQFEDVVGQQVITQTLENAIAHNHLAQALLFCGPRGVGKTTCARILARKINENGKEPEGEDFAFNIFELDAASNNSVDDIRSLIDQVRIPPQVGKYKVYIIDEVHMLSQSAFNAFLKTLEEPPKHAIFILATTEKHKIIPTILSRCQIFDFKRITVSDAALYLKEIAKNQEITADEEALHMIAQKADGAMRDALSIFDRVVSFSGKNLTRQAVAENLNVLDVDVYFRTTDLILSEDIPGLLLQFNEILSHGYDGHHFISGLASHFRDLMVCRSTQTVGLLETSESSRQRYLEQAAKSEGNFLITALDIANSCDLQYKNSKNQRLLVELCLMKLASISLAEKKKEFNDIPIIPASKFKNYLTKIPDTTITETLDTAKAEQFIVDPLAKEPKIPEENQSIVDSKVSADKIAPTSNLLGNIAIQKPGGQGKVSALSLSSIRAKKEHLANKSGEQTETSQLPEDPFEESELQDYWKLYSEEMERQGQKILASNLSADIPKLLGDNTIWIELPNSTMKKEVEREQMGLLQYLRSNLNNYQIALKITVNEEIAQQYAFTPEEKYQKLREKNPALDLLRKTFDLEL
jgi:DNA polymerase-3 subunit gamma/tau